MLWQNTEKKAERMLEQNPEKVADSSMPVEQSYFAVILLVCALGDGKLILEGARKKQDVLEQVVRNVSKEQNTVVHVPSEGTDKHLKMRVFVENSIEAKAVVDYIASYPNQNPAPFVMLSRKLHIAVSYDSNDLNISTAAVADRLRKQAKTRAVKVVREAIADPMCGATMRILSGFAGPHATSLCLDKYITSRSSFIGSDRGKCWIVFPAKNKCVSLESVKASSASSHTAIEQRPQSSDSLLTAFFPVSLFITAIGDGTLARDIPSKLKDRLVQVLSKIPKEQHTCVEVQGEGVVDIKLRVFVTNSEDAKAVGDYIRTHDKQVPAPFVILARDLPMALLFDPKMLDIADSSVADRLRKQAKTRAVKLLREIIAQDCAALSLKGLRGYHGPFQPASVLEQALKSKASPIKGHSTTHKYISFAARNKTISPMITPSSQPSPPLPHILDNPHSRARQAGYDDPEIFHKRGTEKKVSSEDATCRRARGKELVGERNAAGKRRHDDSSSPPPLRVDNSHLFEQDDSNMADAMLLIASSARAYADAHDESGDDTPKSSRATGSAAGSAARLHTKVAKRG